jgi:hypothetical protein
MTIRRVLDFFDEKGIMDRTFGGVVFRAQPATALINPHDIVFPEKERTTASVLRYADPTIPFKTDRKIASDLYKDLKFMGVLADIHNY